MSFSRSLKERANNVWEDGYHHPFVQGLGQGTLDPEAFKFYLVQDYLYLLQYAKVFAAAVVKSDTEELMAAFSRSQDFILNGEMELHRAYMKQFGIGEQEASQAKSSLYNRCYTANMLHYGLAGGLAELLAAVFPCAWTYADYGARLKVDFAEQYESNPYKSWIDMYASEDFAQSFTWFFDALDGLVEHMSPAQRETIAEIFVSSVEFEYLFWDMAFKQQMSY